MFEESEEEHESSANTPLEEIRSASRELNMRTQTILLAKIIKEVIFDPDAGAIVVTLVDDAAEQMVVHPTSLGKRDSGKAAVNRSSVSSTMLLALMEIFSAASQSALKSRPPR